MQPPKRPELFLNVLFSNTNVEFSDDFYIINAGPYYIFSKIEFSINILEHSIHVKQFNDILLS